MKSLVALALFVVTVGCASDPEPSVTEPSIPAAGNLFQVELSRQANGTITALVLDEAGLIVGVQKSDASALQLVEANAVVVANPDLHTLNVAWIGGICMSGPRLTIAGDPVNLTVVLEPEAGEPLTPGGACDAIGMSYGVSLLLSEPVTQEAVSLQVVR